MATVVEGSIGGSVPPSAIDLDIVQCLEACPMLDVSVFLTIYLFLMLFPDLSIHAGPTAARSRPGQSAMCSRRPVGRSTAT